MRPRLSTLYSVMSTRRAGLLLIFVLVLVLASVAHAQTPAQFFDSNGVQIHYIDQGEGEPVLLVHGFTGSYARHWQASGVMEALGGSGYRVIALDCRGHGRSGKPHDPGQYGEEMVLDVLRLLDHLDIDRAHVVGYSLGGHIVTQLSVGHPSRLLTATLVGAGWEGEDLREFTAQTQELAAAFEDEDAGLMLRLMTPPGEAPPTEEEIAAVSASVFARNDPRALAAVGRSMTELAKVSAASLRANTVPALALVGGRDPEAEAVERLAGVMSNLDVIKLPGATHASSVRAATESLLEFLGRHGVD